ncbi:MAG: metal-sensitive transcriptional regulator [Actinobacteria bacterium]|nr:metal-sensitive transcriptional regulator [Actinomycetota bacterium]
MQLPPVKLEGILTTYLNEDIQKNVISRLNRIEGQVRGVKKMIEEQADCESILMQVASLRAALGQVGRIVLDDHMRTCVTDCVNKGEGEKALAKLARALDRLLK